MHAFNPSYKKANFPHVRPDWLALRREAVLQSQMGVAHDYLEGTAAFLDKRPPVFKDR